jgi:HAE1 family hydrophobic/amphiphilic exporter-1
VLFPGAGSELYRGLGSVVVGGLMMSALLTLLIIPPMLSLTLAAIEGRRETADTTEPETAPSPAPKDTTPEPAPGE